MPTMLKQIADKVGADVSQDPDRSVASMLGAVDAAGKVSRARLPADDRRPRAGGRAQAVSGECLGYLFASLMRTLSCRGAAGEGVFCSVLPLV